MWSRSSGAGFIGAERGRWSERSAMAVCALLVLFAVWLLARVFWSLQPADDVASAALPRSAASAQPAATVAVSKWHLFGDAPQRLAANRNAPATTLALRLRGTLADADPRGGIAVIADDLGNERAWRVGEDIIPGVTLDEVHADRVVLLHVGVQEVLPLVRDESMPASVVPAANAPRGGAALRNTAPAAGPGSIAPLSFVPPQIAHGAINWQQTMDTLGGSPESIARRVQVTPVIDNGRIAGVRVSAADDAALMARLGLRPSDIVTAVNGVPVDSVARGQQILESLGSATDVRVTVTRDGAPVEITMKLR